MISPSPIAPRRRPSPHSIESSPNDGSDLSRFERGLKAEFFPRLNAEIAKDEAKDASTNFDDKNNMLYHVRVLFDQVLSSSPFSEWAYACDEFQWWLSDDRFFAAMGKRVLLRDKNPI